jgi:hypothetical protein
LSGLVRIGQQALNGHSAEPADHPSRRGCFGAAGTPDGRLRDTVTSGRIIGTHAPIGRQADELATRLVAVSGQTITVIIMASKKTRPSLSARASFFSSSQINSGDSRH